MKRILPILLLSAGIVLSMAGCQKGTPSEYSGKTIQFGALTGAPTRTAYSGEGTMTDGKLTWERINWVDGDKIMIASDKALGRQGGTNQYATYSLFNINKKSDTQSVANIADDEGKGLVWGDDDSEEYTFWGVYPASVGNGADLVEGKAPFSIAAEQGPDTATDGVLAPDMDQAVMLAKKTGAKPSDHPVDLQFYPAFTAFEFVLTGAAEEVDLTKIELISTSNLCGTVTATIAEEGATTFSDPTSAGKVLTYVFPEGTTVTNETGKTLTFTVFALPIDVNKLQLRFYSNDTDYQVATLKKKVDGVATDEITFAACRKHKIYGLAVPDGTWHVYLEADVLDWIEEQKSIEYGQADADGVVVSASALEKITGTSSSGRTEWTLSSATSVLKAYYSVYSPTNGKWRITLKGDGADQFVLTTDKTGTSTATGDGNYLEGAVDGRIIFTLTPVEGAASGASVELWFTVVMTEGEGDDAVEKEYLLHSEVTRSSLPLTVKLP